MTRVALFFALLPIALVVGGSVSNDAATPAPNVAHPTELCQPEGTVWRNVKGRFAKSGDRLTFQNADSAGSVCVLENRCLERVDRLITDKGADVLWSIDGTLTEFRGANLLLLTRATLERTDK